jgi:hypothetical protein
MPCLHYRVNLLNFGQIMIDPTLVHPVFPKINAFQARKRPWKVLSDDFNDKGGHMGGIVAGKLKQQRQSGVHTDNYLQHLHLSIQPIFSNQLIDLPDGKLITDITRHILIVMLNKLSSLFPKEILYILPSDLFIPLPSLLSHNIFPLLHIYLHLNYKPPTR